MTTSTPIISPWFFYFLQSLDFLNVAFILLFVSAALSTGALFLVRIVIPEDYEYTFKNHPHFFRNFIIVTIISCLGACFIPSEKTLIAMELAKNVTYERLDYSVNVVQDVYNDIINLSETYSDDDN